MLSLIVAAGLQHEIGYQGKMPWHLPGDLAYFKKITMGKTMIMGRRTFEALPGVLPGRKHIVYSRTGQASSHPMVEYRTQLLADLSVFASIPEEFFVIGGGTLYEHALPYASRVYFTQVNGTFTADTFFPVLNEQEWELIAASETQQLEKDQVSYNFRIYERRKCT